MARAREAVERRDTSIRLACEALFISQNCYRYEPKLSDENAEIADWLVRLTHNKKNWGFGPCFLFLRNIKGFRWNHKRVYRTYWNRTSRYDWLNQYLFRTIEQVREYATPWPWTYNHERPNMALVSITPKQ